MSKVSDVGFAIIDCVNHLPHIRSAIARMGSPVMEQQYKSFHNALQSYAAANDLLIQDFGDESYVHRFPDYIRSLDANSR